MCNTYKLLRFRGKISKEMRVGRSEWCALASLLGNSHNEHMKEDLHHIDFITAIRCGTNGTAFTD